MHNETAFPETGYLRLTCPVTAVYHNDTPERRKQRLLGQISKLESDIAQNRREIANTRRAREAIEKLIEQHKRVEAPIADRLAALNAKLFNQVAGIAV